MSDGPIPEIQVVARCAAAYWSARRSLIANLWLRYSDTVGTQVLTLSLGLISGLLLPRLLGPRGRGELAGVTLWPITMAFLGTLGIDRAATFFVAKDREDSSRVVAASLFLGGILCLLTIVVGVGVIRIALRRYSPHLVWTSLIFLCCTPLLFANSLGTSLLLGRLETRWFNLCRIVQSAMYTLAVVVFFSMKIRSVSGVAAFQACAIAAAALLAVLAVRQKLPPIGCFDWTLTRRMLRYGAQSHFGRMTYYMNERLDQLMMSLFLPSAELGIYVGAVALADVLMAIPRGVAAVTLAAGASNDLGGAWKSTKHSLVVTVLWLIPAAAGLWALAPRVIPLILGQQFASALLPCRILVVGSCASGLSAVLGEAAGSIGRPMISSYAEMLGLGVTVLLLALLLKPYGAVGAAFASTVSYTASMVFNFTCLHRVVRVTASVVSA